MNNIQAKLFTNFQTFQDVTNTSTRSDIKKNDVNYEDKTKANVNFNNDITLNNWLNPESCPRLEEYDDGRTYENAEYYTNPFEVDAYKFESRVQEELGISCEDTKKLLEINAKLKTYLKILYDKKTSENI